MDKIPSVVEKIAIVGGEVERRVSCKIPKESRTVWRISMSRHQDPCQLGKARYNHPTKLQLPQ